MKKRRVNIKDLMKDKNKDYFRSRGFSTIKRSYIDENDEQISELLEFEIEPLSGHPVLKEFIKTHSDPKPPVKRELINTETGKSVTQENVSIKEVKGNPLYKWANILDFTDEGFMEEQKEYLKQIRLLQMMICFPGAIEEFGVDKIGDFETHLEELGFTSNQLNKIGEDIKNLDFFTESNK